MNIIETVKQLITNYDKVAEFTNDIHVDFTEESTIEAVNYGIRSTGDTLLNEDILGNQNRRHNFVLYAVNRSYNDYDRLTNSTFLLDFSYWLEKQKGQEVTINVNGTELVGKITSMSCANAMMFDVINSDYNNGAMYQIQIYANYSVESEE